MDTKYFFSKIPSILRFKAPVNDFACFEVSPPTGKRLKALTGGIIQDCGGNS